MTQPVTTDPKQIVRLFRDMGLVGAGGAGFPTYFKYLKPTPILIVNCEEGEPGYEADKLLLISYADQIKETLEMLKRIFGFERIVIGAKEKDKEMLDPLAQSHGFELYYTPSTYGYGEERWLTKAVTGREVPGKQLPATVGVTVNNVETIFNMYRALFEEQPVTDKYLNIYGEVAEPRVYCTPVGTFSMDLLAHSGIDTRRHSQLMVIDGGPLMGDLVDIRAHAILKKTNGLLVVDKALYVGDQVALKQLPGEASPTWEDTLPRAMAKLGLSRYLHWKPQAPTDVRSEIRRVRIYLTHTLTPIVKASIPSVYVGDRVKRGQLVAKPLDGPIEDIKTLSVAQHASIDGTVKEITGEYIVIEREASSAQV
jgi:Na+-translocating ferredoxin:NAD+ oxidoreductase RnfC subunit